MEATAKKNRHGANLKCWREWKGVKQELLAEQVGMSQATLSYYEKKDRIEPELLEKFANALGITVEAITELDESHAINIITSTFTANDNATNAVGNYLPTFNPIDKVIELCNEKNALYERMLKEKDDVIELLQEVLKEKK